MTPLRKKVPKANNKSNKNDTVDGSEEKAQTPADIKRRSVASTAAPDYSVLDNLRQARLNLLDRSSPVLAEDDTSLTDELMKGLRSTQQLICEELQEESKDDEWKSGEGEGSEEMDRGDQDDQGEVRYLFSTNVICQCSWSIHAGLNVYPFMFICSFDYTSYG